MKNNVRCALLVLLALALSLTASAEGLNSPDMEPEVFADIVDNTADETEAFDLNNGTDIAALPTSGDFPDESASEDATERDIMASDEDFLCHNSDSSLLIWYVGSSNIVFIPDYITGMQDPFLYKDDLEAVVIPGSVKYIPTRCFRNKKKLTSVTLHEGLERISEGAFIGCSSLSEIVIPASVKTIAENAFNGCTNLVRVSILGNDTQINPNAFNGCSALRLVVFPPNCTHVGGFNNTGLERVTIPEGVTDVEESAFGGCENLVEVNLPSTLVNIGTWSFGATAIKEITLPESVDSIGCQAFSGCRNLESIRLPGRVSHFGDVKQGSIALGMVFNECSKLRNVVLPEGITSLCEYCFNNCTSLESVTLPTTLKEIGAGAFHGTALKSIDLHEGITTISGFAFQNCKNLTRVEIPGSVTELSGGAFSGCDNLKDIVIYSHDVGSWPTNAYSFSGVPGATTYTMYCDCSVRNWAVKKGFDVNIMHPQDSVVVDPAVAPTTTSTGRTEGSHCALCGEVIVAQTEIPKLVQPTAAPTAKPTVQPTAAPTAAPTAQPTATPATGRRVVNGATYRLNGDGTASYVKPSKSQKEISVPNTVVVDGKTIKVTSIEKKAFYKDKKLTKVTIGKNVQDIGDSAFYGCEKLKSVKGGSAIKSIGASAFSGCKSLTSITLASKVATIGKKAFYDCAALKTITVKTAKLTSKAVGSKAFKGIAAKATFKCPKNQLKDYTALLKKAGTPKTATYK